MNTTGLGTTSAACYFLPLENGAHGSQAIGISKPNSIVNTENRLALPLGTVIQQYKIDSLLGYGGFGIVYKAEHVRLGKRVAIKEYLPSDLATREGTTVYPLNSRDQSSFEEGRSRFLAEAKQLVQFGNHPNIVDCIDFIEENGTAYLIMNFEDGLPLSDIIRRREANQNPLTENELLGVMRPLLEGLKTVHENGVLHRDIKPGNVFIRRSTEQPVLIDFGAAKQNFSTHTKSMAPYSPGYAAYEQIETDGSLGPWTDIYAIGAMMWRIVACQNPVPVEKRTSAKAFGKPDPMPPAVQLGAGRFSNNLLRIIDTCIALNETERFQTVAELINALEDKGRHSADARTNSTTSTRENASQEQSHSQDGSRPTVTLESKSPAVQNNILIEEIAIVTLGEVFTIIVPAGEKTPFEKGMEFSTAEDNQHTVLIRLARGQPGASSATSLGEYEISNIPPAPKGVPRIQLTLLCKPHDNSLELYAVDNSKNVYLQIKKTKDGGTPIKRSNPQQEKAEHNTGKDGFNDVFSDVFGDVFRNVAAGAQPAGDRGADLKYTLELNLSDAVNGTESKIEVPNNVLCSSCMGTGAGKGTAAENCTACQGSGQLSIKQGMFDTQHTCPYCSGRGVIIKSPCPACQGQGMTPGKKTLAVKVPAGVDTGDRIRLRGEGEKRPGANEAGDLYIEIKVLPHQIFGREGNDLHMELTINAASADKGAIREIDVLGKKFKLKIPPGSKNGQTLRMNGMGVTGVRDKSKGDLLVHLKLVADKASENSGTDHRNGLFGRLFK